MPTNYLETRRGPLCVPPRTLKLSEAALLSLAILFEFIIAAVTVFGVNAAYQVAATGAAHRTGDVLSAALLTATLYVSLQFIRDGYTLPTYLSSRGVRLATMSWLAVFFVLGWVGFLLKVTSDFSRVGFTLSFVVGLVFLSAARLILIRASEAALHQNRLVLRSAYVIRAAGEAQDEQCERLMRHAPRNGVRIVGVSQLGASGEWQGSARDIAAELRAAFQNAPFAEVYIILPWARRDELRQVMWALNQMPVRALLVSDPSFSDLITSAPVGLAGCHAFEVQRPPLSTWELAAKRGLDVAVALVALLSLLPLLAMVSLALYHEGDGPVIFRQRRKGFGGKPFTIFKFRTMRVLEDGESIVQAQRNDSRVTRLGALLRKTSIDELPQLWNVLIGDMSIVGPRPHALAHDNHYDKLIASYANRQHVKPGLTGWAQVNGLRGETSSVEAMAERVSYDLWYISNWSLFLDMKIIVRTACSVLFHKRAY